MSTWLTKQAAGSLTGNETAGLFQNGNFRKVTLATLRDYFLSGSNINLEWDAGTTYNQDDLTSYNDQLWRSLQDNNLNNTPTEGAYWTEVSRSESLTLWSSGVITVPSEFYTVYVLDGVHQLFRLANGTRPYYSSDFLTEYAAGDWELVSERGYLILNITSHGLSVSESLIRSTGAWERKSSQNQIPIAVVKAVVDVNTVVVQLLGNLSSNFTGLTDAEFYYSQADGSLDATPSSFLIGQAISTTQIVVLSVTPNSILDGDYTDITVSGLGTVFTIKNNAVTDAKFRTSAALSVVGRSANSTGNVADIIGTAGQILRISGTTLGFGNDGLNTLSFNTGQGIDSGGVLAIGASATTINIGGTHTINLYATNVAYTIGSSSVVSTIDNGTTSTEINQDASEIALIFANASYTSSLDIKTTGFEIDSDDPGFVGLKYITDFSSHFTDQSLINLGYAQDIFWQTSGETALLGDVYLSGSYQIGFGVASPTAKVHLLAGTTTVAPLKLTAGTAVTTITGSVNDGALEYHGGHLWFTIGSTRYQLDQQAAGTGIVQGANTLTSTLELNGSAFAYNFLVYGANVAFFNSAAVFETGEGVFYVGNVTTAPTAAPTDGVFQWVDTIDGVSRLHIQDTDGNITVI